MPTYFDIPTMMHNNAEKTKFGEIEYDRLKVHKLQVSL